MGFFRLSFLVLWFSTRMTLTFSQQILHGAKRLHMAPLPPRRRPPCPPGLAIGTLNVWDGRGFKMVQAIRAVERGGFNVMKLTKTKISTTA